MGRPGVGARYIVPSGLQGHLPCTRAATQPTQATHPTHLPKAEAGKEEEVAVAGSGGSHGPDVDPIRMNRTCQDYLALARAAQ